LQGYFIGHGDWQRKSSRRGNGKRRLALSEEQSKDVNEKRRKADESNKLSPLQLLLNSLKHGGGVTPEWRRRAIAKRLKIPLTKNLTARENELLYSDYKMLQTYFHNNPKPKGKNGKFSSQRGISFQDLASAW
jgi:hypothetical protein